MKTSAIAVSAIVALLVLGAATVTFAHAGFGLGSNSSSSQTTHSASTSTTTQTSEHDHDNETGDQDEQGQNNQGEGGHLNLTAGTTLTFANLTGHWVAFSNMGNHSEDHSDVEDSFSTKVGNSTGAFTFKVTSGSGGDFNLTITSGKFTINGTTYTVSGGMLSLNEGAEVGTGNGTASGGATFMIHVDGIHGNTTSSAQVGAIRLDVTDGKSTYLVILGSNEGVGEDMGED
jgi:hypothetical protein